MFSNQYALAVLAILFSSTMWGLIWFPMRLLEQSGIGVVWATCIMYIAAALATTWYYRKQLKYIRLSPDLVMLAIVAGITNIAFLMALIEGTVVRVMLLFYLSPLWSVFIGRYWLGERISAVSGLLLLLAMSGTLMMLWQPDVGFPWPQGRADWLALLASVMFSLNNVLGRKLATETMAAKTVVVFWGVVLVSALVLLVQFKPLPAVSNLVISANIAMGAVIIAMTVAVLYGLARMPIYRSAVLMLFELVVAAISAWLLTNEHLSLMEWSGGVLIIAAAYGVALMEKRLEQTAAS